MLPEPIVQKLFSEFKAQADYESAAGTADQLEMRQEFENRFARDSSDPWQIIRDLIA